MKTLQNWVGKRVGFEKGGGKTGRVSTNGATQSSYYISHDIFLKILDGTISCIWKKPFMVQVSERVER